MIGEYITYLDGDGEQVTLQVATAEAEAEDRIISVGEVFGQFDNHCLSITCLKDYTRYHASKEEHEFLKAAEAYLLRTKA